MTEERQAQAIQVRGATAPDVSGASTMARNRSSCHVFARVLSVLHGIVMGLTIADGGGDGDGDK